MAYLTNVGDQISRWIYRDDSDCPCLFCANSLIFVSFFFLSKFVLGILSVVGRRAAASWYDICIHLLGVNG
jgi:hypothetical protein